MSSIFSIKYACIIPRFSIDIHLGVCYDILARATKARQTKRTSSDGLKRFVCKKTDS